MLPGRLRALGALRGVDEILLFAYVCCFALGVPLLMRLPLPSLGRVLGHPRRTRRSAPVPESAERLAGLVSLAQGVGGPFVRSGCLTRSVTLYWFLARAGFDVELCFGLQAPRASQAATGHCWLSREGEPFLERLDPRLRFAEVYRVPAPRRA